MKEISWPYHMLICIIENLHTLFELKVIKYFIQRCNIFTNSILCFVFKSTLRLFVSLCVILHHHASGLRGHSTTTWTRRGGGGVSQKSTLVHSGGGSLECPRGPKPSYFRKYFILLCSVMDGKKGIKWHWIELNSIELNWFKSYSHWKLKVCEFTHWYAD